MTPATPRLPVSLAATVFVAAALAVGACGGSADSGDTAPAGVVPGGTPFYVDLAIDPDGDQEAATRSLVAKFPGGAEAEPGTLVKSLIADALTQSSAPITYAEDIEPWLGPSAGAFLSSIQGEGDGDGAVVLATTDADAAEAALEKVFDGGESRSRSDTTYRVADGTAYGIVEGFAVIGTEPALVAAIDTAGGSSLESSSEFGDATAGLPEERLATVFVDSAGLLDAGIQSQDLSGPEMDAARESLGTAEPVAGSVLADSDGLVLDGAVSPAALGGGMSAQLDSGLIGSLPAESVIALGVPAVGDSLEQAVTQFAEGSGLDLDTLDAFLGPQGLPSIRDLFDSLGDVSVFVDGVSPLAPGGGVIIGTPDPDAAERSLESLSGLLDSQKSAVVSRSDGGFIVESSDLPEPIVVRQDGDRVVFALGEDSAKAALSPDGQLVENDDYAAATARLGEDYGPSLYINLRQIVESLGGFAKLADDNASEVVPYLEPLRDVIGGSREADGRILSRTRIDIE